MAFASLEDRVSELENTLNDLGYRVGQLEMNTDIGDNMYTLEERVQQLENDKE